MPATTTQRRFSVVTAMVAAVVVLTVPACGGGGKPTAVASLAGSHSTTTVKKSKAEAKQEMQDAALAFARCMRQHGVDMPDPTFDDSGGGGMMIKQGGPASSTGARPDDATMKAAQTACQPILDKAQQDMPRPSPAEEAKMRDQALKFAKCMRDHGVDMPDPTFDDNGGMRIEVNGGGSAGGGSGPVSNSSGNGAAPKPPGEDPKMDAAMKACGGPGAGFSTSKAAG
jgi:hypothetical protein